jgi:uncharacterized membrane protein YsdA (DUF1294 family)/cold shock CspA family protein
MFPSVSGREAKSEQGCKGFGPAKLFGILKRMSIVLERPLTARIVEWDDQKGYGYLQVGTRRLFLHRRDFAERHKQPCVGDVIRFAVGQDARGRTCAKNAVHANDGGRITVLAALLLAGLLVLPIMALHQRAADFPWLGGYMLAISAISYGCYARDKRFAREKAWRISEGRLHLTEFLGGWPGAFLAQRRLRHKSAKDRYQVVFWLIVLGYQFAAFDSLDDWHFSRAAFGQIQNKSNHRP